MSKPKKNALYNHQIHLVNKWENKWHSHPRVFQSDVREEARYWSLPKYHGTEYRGIRNWLSKKVGSDF